jgi:hypothetical protein
VTVHTEPELVQKYYENASPTELYRHKENAFKERKVKKSSRSPFRSKSVHQGSPGSQTQKSEVEPLERTVKIKADNTYHYRLPPFIIETFWKSILNSEDNFNKLKEAYEQLRENPKPKYNISDYVNTIDGIVRKVEVELGIQDREIKITKNPSREWCTCNIDDLSHDEQESIVSAPVKNTIENKLTVDNQMNKTGDLRKKAKAIEIERKIEDVVYDSDDVFANNPSSLMLAKVRVIRKFQQPTPEPPEEPPKPKDEK